ncbi:hypothetical protein TKK_0015128 [Trichogramma kaykai]
MNKTIIRQLILALAWILCASARKWDLGTALTYDASTTVLLGDSSIARNVSSGDVGFQLTAKVKVTTPWKDRADPETILLSIKPISLQLWIKSRKAPKPEGFVEHSSRLTEVPKTPILLLMKAGTVKKVFAQSTETISSLNLKKGLASLFQYHMIDDEIDETDASGACRTSYRVTGQKSLEKVKRSCARNKNRHSDPILDVKLDTRHVTSYKLTDGQLPKEVIETEKHEMSLVARPEARNLINVHRVLSLVPGASKEKPVIGGNYVEVINKIGANYVEVPFEAQHELYSAESAGDTLEAVLESSMKGLETLGTIRSATTFLKLLPMVRDASAETLAKILKSPRYRGILPQLYDLYGSASTLESHRAAMKVLWRDNTGDDTERYLWALATAQHPRAEVIKDVLKRSEETHPNEKVSETLALTAAAMARRHGNPSVIERVKDSLELGLDICSEEPCKIKFLRALGNLKNRVAVPILLKNAMNGTKNLAIVAWKALGTLSSDVITPEIKSIAMKTFLQLRGQKVDSSVRTLAINVVLNNNPTVEDIEQLLMYLVNQDPVFEVRKYLVQRIEQLSESSPAFRQNLQLAKERNLGKFVNYNTFAQRGLSTAFTRSFLRSSGSNGSLVTIQEISSGLLKRGVVDIVLENENHKSTLFSLGLYAGGLGNFVSSNEPDSAEFDEYASATAGMELSFQGVDIRPFVFFSGQGELMGHVWSGTASERTSAFQTTVNLHKHREIIPLTCGFVAEIDVEGAMSVDLAGQIQLSLWSRNAHSLVEMEAGVVIQGSSKITANFVQSRAEFSLTAEPKLELATDVDFSGPVSLCMRLVQPETYIKQHIYKVERIPGSRHRLRKTKRIRLLSPAKSYLLNRKNNEMCSKVFEE